MSDDPRHLYRQSFIAAWRKYQQQETLSPLEQQLVAVLTDHPEYITLLATSSDNPSTTYAPDQNPFVHMGLHLTLRDQIQLDQPAGIRALYVALQQRGHANHAIEHRMMEVLAAFLWKMVEKGEPPSPTEYLQQLQAQLDIDNV